MATQATFQPAMFFAGLDGIIEPRLTVREFHDALAQARSGHFVAPRWFNRRISEIIRLSFIGYRSDYIHLMHLTAPEVKVIDLVAQHFENKEIAEKLALSGPLVGKLVRSIYSKLGVRRRTEAAVL